MSLFYLIILKKRRIKKNVKDLSPASNNDTEADKLINAQNRNISNNKKDFVFLSNLEEIVYNPSPVYNKSNNSKFEIKCLNENKMLDKYMELFEP